MSGGRADGPGALRRRVQLATVLAGLAAVAASGEVGLLLAGLGTVGVVLGHRRRAPPGPAALGRWRLANLLSLVLCVLLGVVGVPLLAVGMGLVTWLQVHRALTGASAADGRVSLLLALLHVLLACILSLSGWLGAVFLVFAALVPMLLLLLHIEEASPVGTLGRDRRLGGLWALAPVVVVGTGALFFTIPRLEAGGVGASVDESMVGFDRDMELGDLGAIKNNPEIVLRTRIEDNANQLRREPRYFRGTALDHFDGRRWTATLDGRVEAGWWPDTPGAGVEVLVQESLQRVVEGGVLFGVPQIHSISGSTDRLHLDLNGTWRVDTSEETVRVLIRSVVRSRGVPAPETPATRLRAAGYRAEQAVLRSGALTSLPPGLDPRIATLAETWADEAGPEAGAFARAVAVETAMRRELSYTLVPVVDDAGQPLSGFLFDSRRGHCEYFATALAVMLRTQGIPARVANGFYGGEWNPYGEYLVVRQRDAHAWVEAWFPDQGWVLLDATPAADAPPAPGGLAAAMDVASERWERLVLDYELGDQIRAVVGAVGMLRALGGGGGAALGGVGAGALSAVLLVGGLVALSRLFALVTAILAGERPGLGARPSPVRRIHRRARALVARRGWQVPPGLPPVHAAGWLIARVGDRAEPLQRIAWALYRTELGAADGDPAAAKAELVAAREALRVLRRSLPRRHRA